MSENEEFTVSFTVRDYECDMTGVVNNAVYQNYMEHARHQFLKHLEIDFADLASRQIMLVIVSAELKYRQSLRSGDEIVVKTKVERVTPQSSKFLFIQNIYRQPDNKLILQGKITGAVLNAEGMPELPDEIVKHFPKIENNAKK